MASAQESVLRASRILGLATDLFDGDRAAARRWMVAPRTVLGGKAPLELATTDVGAREVEALIGRLEHGVAP